jgi:predicted nucleotide-binding protein (sugar kinase/HSP70/actin superfamily)
MGAFENHTSVLAAMVKTRKLLSNVKVDRTRIKPKVGIIGEFWAMTTEGDGNYQLQRFLESEGAEVDVQLISAWLLYMVWQGRYDTKLRANLRGTDDDARAGLSGVDVRKKLAILAAADKLVRVMFQTMAKTMGLLDYHLPDMNLIAEISHAFYDNNLRGGEGHMEVGKLIQNVVKSKVNMTLSVKPFGCMPSSSVSDGVQSLITEMYPEGIFLPIETSGDGAVNVYSRVQMQLFKARQAAQREVQRELDKWSMSMEEVQAYLAKHPRLNHSFHKSPHVAGCTTADLVAEVGRRKQRLGFIKQRIGKLVGARAEKKAADRWVVQAAKTAAMKARNRKAVIQDEAEHAGDGFTRPEKPKGKTLRVLN